VTAGHADHSDFVLAVGRQFSLHPQVDCQSYLRGQVAVRGGGMDADLDEG